MNRLRLPGCCLNTMHYDIKLTNFEMIHTAVLRSRVEPKELSKFVPAACGEVWSFIRSAGLPHPGRHMALYLDTRGSVEVGAKATQHACCSVASSSGRSALGVPRRPETRLQNSQCTRALKTDTGPRSRLNAGSVMD